MHLYRRAGRGFGDRVEDRGEFLPFPQHHARGDDDFGVPDILPGQTFEQAASDERVVLGSAQTFADNPESTQKRVEILILVVRPELLDRRRRVEFVQRFGFHRTFQMQMQLRLGHLHDEIVHTCLLDSHDR